MPGPMIKIYHTLSQAYKVGNIKTPAEGRHVIPTVESHEQK